MSSVRVDDLEQVWQTFLRAQQRIEFHPGLDALLVFADGIASAGFERLAKDLSRFANRRCADPLGWALNARERSEWSRIQSRVLDALESLRGSPELRWPRHVQGFSTRAMVRFFHPINPRFDDVAGPFPITRSDVAEPADVRAWLKRHRLATGSGATVVRERGRIVVRSKAATHVIEIGRRAPNLVAREIVDMAERLRRGGFAEPHRYARRLYRDGVRLAGYWAEEPGVSGGRYVRGLRERLFSPNELVETYGFRRTR